MKPGCYAMMVRETGDAVMLAKPEALDACPDADVRKFASMAEVGDAFVSERFIVFALKSENSLVRPMGSRLRGPAKS